jgi:hypothetical protein
MKLHLYKILESASYCNSKQISRCLRGLRGRREGLLRGSRKFQD